MHVRTETDSDIDAIRNVNMAAFGTPAEADLVDRLRVHAAPLVSLVATIDGAVVGHIMFSPVTLEDQPEFKAMGLAPMAVTPLRQRKMVGSRLVREGLNAVSKLNFDAVVVLGHPEYYPRFGFQPASQHGIHCTYDVPNDTFMILELRAGSLENRTGSIRYHAAFDAL